MEKVVFAFVKNKFLRLFRFISKGMGIFFYLCICGYVDVYVCEANKGESKRFVWYVVTTIETALMVARVFVYLFLGLVDYFGET